MISDALWEKVMAVEPGSVVMITKAEAMEILDHAQTYMENPGSREVWEGLLLRGEATFGGRTVRVMETGVQTK